jgi:hypothetical protein
VKPAALDYGPLLADVLDRIDAAEEQLRETVKERKGEIAKLKKRARGLRDLMAGRAGTQLDLAADDAAAAVALAAARKGTP